MDAELTERIARRTVSCDSVSTIRVASLSSGRSYFYTSNPGDL